MKKLGLIAGLAAWATVAQAAFDGSVTITSSAYQNGSGGEFTATASSGPMTGVFPTFCIEVDQHLSFGGTYNYNVNIGAVTGGAGVNDTDSRTGLSRDNLSLGTAWLYSQFRAGTLANYFGANRQVNAGILQNAIWGLEQEITYDSTNPYIIAAKAALGNISDTALKADSGGAYGVVALNLFNGPGSRSVGGYNVNQDVLGIVPEPSTVIAGALLLLPFGASAARILRRKS